MKLDLVAIWRCKAAEALAEAVRIRKTIKMEGLSAWERCMVRAEVLEACAKELLDSNKGEKDESL